MSLVPLRRCLYGLLALACLWQLPAHALEPAATPDTVWLDTMDLTKMIQGWALPQINLSVEKRPLTINGKVFHRGVGTHAAGYFDIDLQKCATRFTASVGLDNEVFDIYKETNAGKPDPTPEQLGSVIFMVYVDGKKMYDSGVMRVNDGPKSVSVDLRGAKKLSLRIGTANDGAAWDHADWTDARIDLVPGTTKRPVAVEYVDTNPAPKIASCEPKQQPEIHGPRIVGTTPGREFIFRIPATGQAPLTYAAENLPGGLTCDAQTGVIRGSLQKAGTTVVTLIVTGPKGKATRKLTIVGGAHKLALTPPMGWNSWNCWGYAVDDAKIRATADVMISSGLAAHGYQYVNIDDAWEAGRAANGEIVCNEKFPDMKALGDYVHSRGLRMGIYSSPGPRTCGNYEGSFGHVGQDAASYAKWGIDYLKYDWCSCSSADLKAPYKLMQDALNNCGRDIVYSLCQYGMGNVWEWGPEVDANCWRTTGDITDTWDSMSGIGFNQNSHEKYAGPGHWNDPDMLVVGRVGWGNPHPSNLTKYEQVTHITLWSIISSPLLIGCDMTKLDAFTRDLLCNDEVIDVNQDPLGKPAGRIRKDGNTEIWARPLWDGTQAVACFNRNDDEVKKITVNFASDLGITAKRVQVRDLWQRKDLGKKAGSYTVTVYPHCAVLLKVGTPKPVDAYIPEN